MFVEQVQQQLGVKTRLANLVNRVGASRHNRVSGRLFCLLVHNSLFFLLFYWVVLMGLRFMGRNGGLRFMGRNGGCVFRNGGCVMHNGGFASTERGSCFIRNRIKRTRLWISAVKNHPVEI